DAARQRTLTSHEVSRLRRDLKIFARVVQRVSVNVVDNVATWRREHVSMQGDKLPVAASGLFVESANVPASLVAPTQSTDATPVLRTDPRDLPVWERNLHHGVIRT